MLAWVLSWSVSSVSPMHAAVWAWGAISDRFGRFQTMLAAVAVTGCIHLFLFSKRNHAHRLHR